MRDSSPYKRYPVSMKAELRISIRKVTNGFSVRLSDSPHEEEIGKIFIANSGDELISQIQSILNNHNTPDDEENGHSDLNSKWD